MGYRKKVYIVSEIIEKDDCASFSDPCYKKVIVKVFNSKTRAKLFIKDCKGSDDIVIDEYIIDESYPYVILL
jgi:hypothetical protein